MKRVIVAAVILAVITVMALRGCPRVRMSAGIPDINSHGRLHASLHGLTAEVIRMLMLEYSMNINYAPR